MESSLLYRVPGMVVEAGDEHFATGMPLRRVNYKQQLQMNMGISFF
jgi:hypothetical protein